jgi:2-polyprenyl-3-methyl-5-hydroxy-6-metoxy-1,4-benzoquinol methylase
LQDAPVKEPNYIFTDTAADAESFRLGLIEQRADDATIRRLENLGVAPGWRCLEVGAGRGSIARWLANRVGPDGCVVAADIDCRHLTGIKDTVEVRTFDVRTDTPETDSYDLVHCRTLLIHVPDPLAGLKRLAAALRPGGVLLAEEADYGLYAYGGHPDAPWLTEKSHQMFAAIESAKIMHPFLGRTLPGMLTTAGLHLEGGEVDSTFARPGEAAYEFERLTAEAAEPAMIAAGILTQEESCAARAIRSASTTVMTTASLIAAWARRRNNSDTRV